MKKATETTLKATLQKSYYGKAKTRQEGDEIILKSYNTDVLAIDTVNACFRRLWNGWSATTMKHINVFLMAHGFAKMNKAIWLSLPCENPAPVYNVVISNGFYTHTAPALLTATECEKTIEGIETHRPLITAWYE